MTKDHIIREICRTASANAGTPLGRERFLAETGIRESDWHGKYWVRWGDAVKEAGFAPNALNRARDRDEMFEKLAAYVRELRHFPVAGELKMKRRSDRSFPDAKTFERFGSKAGLVAAVAEFAERRGYDDVVGICATLRAVATSLTGGGAGGSLSVVRGYVYLVKHGSRRQFKIGKTQNPIRREGEIAVELPETLEPVHVIQTDDPAGVESYWHRRFATKRLKNEWFTLTVEDVQAFKRWRKIF
jgi:hypothetical protein